MLDTPFGVRVRVQATSFDRRYDPPGCVPIRYAQPVRISDRSSSITNSFVNGIIPVVPPTVEQIDNALRILGMENAVGCAYCGDRATEWDHLRPVVVGKQPTGYISDIHNLVPACGKCNQNKGNNPWRVWMFSSARLSPDTRGVVGLEEQENRLAAYEQWETPTIIDFAAVVGDQLWAEHWHNHAAILQAIREAETTVELIRTRVAVSCLVSPALSAAKETGISE